MKKALLIPVAAAVWAAAASAQVMPTQDGRALDANYGLGTGGYNSVSRSNRAFDSNLYVTGQVGGGFYAFHGTVGYAASDQLRLTLPSAGLDSFLARSAGVDWASHPVYGPEAYYAPSRTVLGPGGIAGGLGAPGTSVPRSAYVSAPAAEEVLGLYDRSIQAYKPIMPNLTDPEILRTMLLPPTGMPALTGPSPAPAFRPPASALFGVLRQQEWQQLAKELAEAKAAGEGGQPQPIGPLYGPIQPLTPEELAGAPQPGRADRTVSPLPQPGQDVFLDLLVRLNEMRQQEQADQTAQPQQGPPTRRERPEADLTEPSEELPKRAPPPSVERTRENEVIIHSLAGKNRDQFNLHLAEAEKLLSRGKFYHAAQEYRLAIILNRDYPTAWLGTGLALIGANEPLSASFNIAEAMRRYPPLLETSVDLKRLLGEEVVKSRLEELLQRIARQGEAPEASLVFLAAFIQTSVEGREKAADLAQTLRQVGQKDELYPIYAEYLLTGKRPAAATQPAGVLPG